MSRRAIGCDASDLLVPVWIMTRLVALVRTDAKRSYELVLCTFEVLRFLYDKRKALIKRFVAGIMANVVKSCSE